MKKGDKKGKFKSEAFLGLVLMVSLVGGGLFFIGNSQNPSEPAATLPAQNQNQNPGPGNVTQDPAYETYFGSEPVGIVVPVSAQKITKTNIDDSKDSSSLDSADEVDLDDIVIIDDSDNETDHTDEEVPDDVLTDDELDDWVNT